MPPPTPDLSTYRGQLSFIKRKEESAGVSTYVFTSEDPIPFSAGQYAHIKLLSMPEEVRRVHEFSFAGAPGEAEIWFGIDTRSGSAYQQALAVLVPGDVVEIFKIKGHLTWPPATAEVVMIAGGVGVTPFRSMLLDAKNRPLPITSTLIHVSRAEHLYKKELAGLAQTYLPIQRGEFEQTLEEVARSHANAHFYLAGSGEFVTQAAAYLSQKGITKIESDEFKGLLPE